MVTGWKVAFSHISNKMAHYFETSNEVKKSIIKCALCEESFDTLENMINHLKKSHSIKFRKLKTQVANIIHKCLICNNRFKSLENLVHHFINHKIEFEPLKTKKNRVEIPTTLVANKASTVAVQNIPNNPALTSNSNETRNSTLFIGMSRI